MEKMFFFFVIVSLFSGCTWIEGKKNIVIAVGENPSDFEKKAADELQYFLSKVTGSEYEIVPESKAGKEGIIYVGQTKFALSNGADFAKADKEEWILKSIGDSLIISGGRPVGTLYGVYEFLEKQGVYFLAMDQSVIPQKKEIILTGFKEKSKPAFAGRNIYDNFSADSSDRASDVPGNIQKEYWTYRLRSRLNGGHGINRKGVIDAIYSGDMFNLTMSFHTLSYYVDPKLFDTHPEYFSMNEKGERVKPKSFFAQGSLCMSNKEVWNTTLDSLRKYIKRDRAALPKEKWPVVYDISILDNTPYICFCPECSKIIKEEGGAGGLNMRYINYVASEIAKEYPEIKIRTFAYSVVKDVPVKTRPAPNVICQYCDEFPLSDCYRPLDSEFNKQMLAQLKKWHNTGVQIALWDYWNLGGQYFNPSRIETVTDAIQPDMKLFHKLGILSLFIEAEKDPIKPQNFIDLNYFLVAQLMINPDQDQEKLIRIFMDGYYGAASEYMKKYLKILRDGMKNHPGLQRTMRVARWNFITPAFMLDSYRMLKKAESATPAESLYRKRIHYEMIPLLWQILISRIENEKNFQDAGISMGQIEKECREYCIEYIRRNNPKKPEVFLKEFEEQFAMLTAKLPVPERFKKYNEGDIRVYGYPQFRPAPHVFGNIVDDAESTTGKALMSSNPSLDYHGAKTVVKGKNWSFRASQFTVACLDVKGEKKITIENIPSDEKYHWYKIPEAEISSKCLLWGHCWALQFDLSQAYQLADGISDNNIWDVWFSAKFTGPTWVKDSKQQNAVYLDMVVLTRPGVK